MALELWLRSNNPERFAHAMSKCEHSGGLCASDGYCHFNGSCFDKDKTPEKEVSEILTEINERLTNIEKALGISVGAIKE